MCILDVPKNDRSFVHFQQFLVTHQESLDCSIPSSQLFVWEWDCVNEGWSHLASFPGSHAPEREIEVVQAWRAWYFLSREKRQR